MRTTYGPVRLLESLRIESARGVLFVGIFLALLLLRVVTGHYAAKTSHQGKIQVNKRKCISSKMKFIRFKEKKKEGKKRKERKPLVTYLRTRKKKLRVR